MTDLHPTRGYIGGGTIAGMLGLSPFKTPLDEYLQIVNELQDELTPEEAEFFENRRDLEPWASKKFERKTGMRIFRTNYRFEDSEFSWAKAEIDFEVEDGGNGETKTVHPNAISQWGDPEADEPPLYVTAQAMWGMGINGAGHCYVQALIGFDDHRIYRIERDDDLIADIRAKALSFWTHYVMSRRMPPPTSVEDLLRLYPRSSGRAVEASTEIQLALQERDRSVRIIKAQELHKLSQDLQIKMYMRDAENLTVGGMTVATWKARADGVRVFRIR